MLTEDKIRRMIYILEKTDYEREQDDLNFLLKYDEKDAYVLDKNITELIECYTKLIEAIEWFEVFMQEEPYKSIVVFIRMLKISGKLEKALEMLKQHEEDKDVQIIISCIEFLIKLISYREKLGSMVLKYLKLQKFMESINDDSADIKVQILNEHTLLKATIKKEENGNTTILKYNYNIKSGHKLTKEKRVVSSAGKIAYLSTICRNRDYISAHIEEEGEMDEYAEHSVSPYTPEEQHFIRQLLPYTPCLETAMNQGLQYTIRAYNMHFKIFKSKEQMYIQHAISNSEYFGLVIITNGSNIKITFHCDNSESKYQELYAKGVITCDEFIENVSKDFDIEPVMEFIELLKIAGLDTTEAEETINRIIAAGIGYPQDGEGRLGNPRR